MTTDTPTPMTFAFAQPLNAAGIGSSAWLGIVIMELTQLLKDAQQEIQQLRRRNEILGAKVEVMDSFMCVLHTKPAEHLQAMSVDIAWQLGQKVAEIEANKPAEAQMPNTEVSN